jgi:hypothetical protein
MALDLSGFVIPENKFEGLYKAADTLAAREKTDTAALAAKNKKTGDAYKTLADITNIDADFGTPYDSRITAGVNNINEKGLKYLNDNKGATTEELRAYLYKDVSDLNNYVNVSKSARKYVDNMLQDVDGDFYDKPALKKAVFQIGMYNDDETQKDWNEVKFDEETFDKAVSKYGRDIMKEDGFIKALKQAPTQERKIVTESRDASGRLVRNEKEEKWHIWEQEELDDKGKPTGRYEPKHMYAQDEGVNLKHEGEDVKIATDDVFDYWYNRNRKMRDLVDAQAKFHSNEYDVDGVKLDENSPQAKLVKKAILFDILDRNRSGKMDIESTDKKRLPKTGRGGRGPSASQQAQAYDENELHKALSEQNPTDGYYDVKEYINQGYKYGRKRFGKNGIKYNPTTKKFKISLVDENGDESEVEESYAKVYSKIKTSNDKADMTFFQGFKTFKPKKKKIVLPD